MVFCNSWDVFFGNSGVNFNCPIPLIHIHKVCSITNVVDPNKESFIHDFCLVSYVKFRTIRKYAYREPVFRNVTSLHGFLD